MLGGMGDSVIVLLPPHRYWWLGLCSQQSRVWLPVAAWERGREVAVFVIASVVATPSFAASYLSTACQKPSPSIVNHPYLANP